MIIASKTYHRLDTTTPWHFKVVETGKAEFVAQLNTYQGNLIMNSSTLSDDELSITFVTVWENEEAYELYKVDPILNVYWGARDEYNTSVGITADTTSVETV